MRRVVRRQTRAIHRHSQAVGGKRRNIRRLGNGAIELRRAVERRAAELWATTTSTSNTITTTTTAGGDEPATDGGAAASVNAD
jgi:hypothetical protein